MNTPQKPRPLSSTAQAHIVQAAPFYLAAARVLSQSGLGGDRNVAVAVELIMGTLVLTIPSDPASDHPLAELAMQRIIPYRDDIRAIVDRVQAMGARPGS
jgi:hypothetical protein